jgi:hypothetical protein
VVLNKELNAVFASADIDILHLMYRFCDAPSVCRIDTLQPPLDARRISPMRIFMCSAPNSLIGSDCRDLNTPVRVASPCTPMCKAPARTKFQSDFIRALRAGGSSRTFRLAGLPNVNR